LTLIKTRPGRGKPVAKSQSSRNAIAIECDVMPSHSQSLAILEAEARQILGERASEWLVKPSKLLDGMIPAEFATTPEGLRVVLHELRRAAIPLRAAIGDK